MNGLMFHEPTGSFVIGRDALKHASFSIKHAIKLTREMGGRPLEPHKRPGAMTNTDFLEKTLIDLAGEIGIDLGCQWPGQLDLRERP